MARYDFTDFENSNAKRQKFLEDILAKKQLGMQSAASMRRADELKLQKQQEAEQFASDTNAQSGALTGASLGASAGPWGALIGGAAGLGMGMAREYGAEKKKHGKWGAIWNTVKDVVNPVKATQNLYDAITAPGGAQKAAAVAGSVGGAIANKYKTAAAAKKAAGGVKLGANSAQEAGLALKLDPSLMSGMASTAPAAASSRIPDEAFDFALKGAASAPAYYDVGGPTYPAVTEVNAMNQSLESPISYQRSLREDSLRQTAAMPDIFQQQKTLSGRPELPSAPMLPPSLNQAITESRNGPGLTAPQIAAFEESPEAQYRSNFGQGQQLLYNPGEVMTAQNWDASRPYTPEELAIIAAQKNWGMRR